MNNTQKQLDREEDSFKQLEFSAINGWTVIKAFFEQHGLVS